MERKKRVDMHINIATALSDCIRARNLDKFFEVQNSMYYQHYNKNIHRKVIYWA